ncbi:MAG: glycine cleavage system protein GcvH [Propionibacteriaceae bacterium]|nr:glycine cleavage system protein GcvH [Propionibacteriaceae bacterium]
MTNCPQDLKYTTDHEWVQPRSGDTVRVGITQHAVEALSGIVFLSLPTIGQSFSQGEQAMEVESTKAVSEVFAPLDGVVVAVNEDAANNPDCLSEDPYEAGWLFELEMSDTPQLDTLLDAQAYTNLIE